MKKDLSPQNKDLKLGTWNVNSMLKAGTLEELKVQMRKANLDILGLCETRWNGNGDFSGNKKRGEKGLAIILRGKWKKNVLNTYHMNERLLMIKLEAKPVNIYIIQVYSPTTRSKEVEIEEIYDRIEELLQLTENNANVFITGDFNACVGCEETNNSGKFGLGKSNERGKRLIKFCEQQEMMISNTFFEVPIESVIPGKHREIEQDIK